MCKSEGFNFLPRPAFIQWLLFLAVWFFSLSRSKLPSLKSVYCIKMTVANLMAFFAAWSAWLGFCKIKLPQMLFLVETVKLKLSASVGRIALVQRIDTITPWDEFFLKYDYLAEGLNEEMESALPLLVTYAMDLQVEDGIMFDQLLHSTLHFSEKFDGVFLDGARVVRQLMYFAKKLTNQVYRAQFLGASHAQ